MIRFIRWKWLLPRLVLLSAATAGLWFGFDPLVQWSITAAAQRVVRAKVDIDRLETSLAKTEVRVHNLQIANPRKPMENLFEAGEVSLSLETGPLLRKQYIVREGRITGLRFGTPRKASGAIDRNTFGWDLPDEAIDAAADRLADYGELGVERLLALLQKEAVRQLEELETVRLARQLSRQWPAEFDRMETRVRDLKEQIDHIRTLFENGGRDAKTLLRDADGLARAAADLDQIQREIAELPGEVDRLCRQALRDKDAILTARDRDIAQLRERVNPGNLAPEKFSEYLLGPEVGQQVVTLIQWINWARRHLPAKVEGEDPSRSGGVDVLFAGLPQRPDFLIQRLLLDGEGSIDDEPIQFIGTAEQLTTQPVLCGRPAVLKLELRGKIAATLEATIDRTQATPHDHLKILCPGIAQPPRVLGQPDRFAIFVSPGSTRLSLDLDLAGDELSGRLSLRQEPVELAADLGPRLRESRLSANLDQALGEIRCLDLSADLRGTLKKPRWQFHSDLGSQLAHALDGLIQREWDAMRTELAEQAQRRAEQEISRYEELILAKQEKLLGNLQLTSREINEIRTLVAQRVPRADDLIRKNLPANLPLRFY